MANSSVEPLWNLNATFDGIQVFNGTILYAEVDSQAAGGLFPGTSMMLNETSVSYNSTLNITFEESDYPTYILDQRGCRIGSADPDCPAACSNIDTLFDSLQTTYNCFLAPYVGTLVLLFKSTSSLEAGCRSAPEPGSCGGGRQRLLSRSAWFPKEFNSARSC